MSHLFFSQLQDATKTAREQMLSASIISACRSGDINIAMYQSFLTQAYHHVKHTVPLLMACGSRLPGHYEWLQDALSEYIEEEKGHHLWILDDIRACDGDIDAVKENRGQGRVHPAIELMVSYLYYQIDRLNPLALFGMVWVLEGTSVSIGGTMAELIQKHLSLPDQAMTYLRSHSTLDQEHIRLFAGLMDQITDSNDQHVIIDSANMIFSLYGQMLNGLNPTENEVG
ncbi:MAG: hypothetical protein CENE_02900 [Candidatus Celerinatantimonas neptuna]|nr:MAG: hypothetical protein CENE_02900 [Candidatus Celerinatantimonas neptuna]